MNRIAFLLVILNLFHYLSVAQQTNLDSLWAVWEDESQADTNRLKSIFELALQAKKNSTDSALYLLDQQAEMALSSGHQKFVALAYYHKGAWNWNIDQDTAIVYLSKAKDIFQGLGETKRTSNCLLYLGAIYRDRGNYDKTVGCFTQSIVLLEEIGDKEGIALSSNNIGVIYLDRELYEEAEQWFNKALHISQEIGNQDLLAQTLLNLGLIYSQRDSIPAARKLMLRSLALRNETQNGRGIGTALINIGNLFENEEVYDSALVYYQQALIVCDSVGFTQGKEKSLNNLGMVYFLLEDYDNSLKYTQEALKASQNHGNIKEVQHAAKRLHAIHRKQGRYDKALDAYELYVSMHDSLESVANKKAIIRQEYEYQYEKEALADSLEFAKKEAILTEESKRQRMGLFAAAGGVFLFILLAYSIYRGKKRSDELLLNILPKETAKELKEKGYVDAKQFDEVTVLFTDFKGFTQISERLSPSELVAAIDECFKAFDEIMTKYGIEKIKTIGDSYMAAGGLPAPNQTKPEDVVKAALEMRDWMLDYKTRKGENGFEIRIGVHTGPVVAGIVGIKKFQYDIWGDTVNTASRIESSGEVGKVNISEATYKLLKDNGQFSFESRGKIKAKGKGEIEMYFVDTDKD